MAVKEIRQTLRCPVISISAEHGNDLMPLSQQDIVLDWCYDKIVSMLGRNGDHRAAQRLTNFFYRHHQMCIRDRLTELSSHDRIRILHDFFRSGEEQYFNFDLSQALSLIHI